MASGLLSFTCTGVPPPSPPPALCPLRLSGHSCPNDDYVQHDGTLFVYQGITLDGRPWYRGEGGYGQRGASNPPYLFYDIDCDGWGAKWYIGCYEPNVTVSQQLMFDGVPNPAGCCNDANIASTALVPPASSSWWRWCGNTADSGSLQLTLTEDCPCTSVDGCHWLVSPWLSTSSQPAIAAPDETLAPVMCCHEEEADWALTGVLGTVCRSICHPVEAGCIVPAGATLAGDHAMFANR